MRTILSSFTIASVLCMLSDAGAFLPQPTGQLLRAAHPVQGWSAQPTPSPNLELLKRRLKDNMNLARQAAISFTSGELLGFVAPDNTCGYVNGQFGAPKSCGPSSTCFALAPISGEPGKIGCAYGSDIGQWSVEIACVNYDQFWSSSICDHACQQNTDFLLCTDKTAPYCYGYTFPQLTATAHLCDATFASTWDTILTSSIGDTAGHSFLPQYYTSSAATSSSFFSSRLIPASSSSISSTAPIQPATSAPTTPQHSNAGPIAGGVVGGLIAIGGTISSIAFFCLHRRRRDTTQPAGEPKNEAPTQDQSYYPPSQHFFHKNPTESVPSYHAAPVPPYFNTTSFPPPAVPSSFNSSPGIQNSLTMEQPMPGFGDQIIAGGESGYNYTSPHLNYTSNPGEPRHPATLLQNRDGNVIYEVQG